MRSTGITIATFIGASFVILIGVATISAFAQDSTQTAPQPSGPSAGSTGQQQGTNGQDGQQPQKHTHHHKHQSDGGGTQPQGQQ
jgi:hypothetical protein